MIMNDFHDVDDSLELGFKTWHRLMDGMNKAGYRDGIEEGSQAVLQADFDKGYVDGFKVAFILGKYKGLATFTLKGITHPKEIDGILENTKKGACHICELEVLNGNITGDPELIINIHREHVSKILSTLYSYFQPLLKDQGIDISYLKYE